MNLLKLAAVIFLMGTSSALSAGGRYYFGGGPALPLTTTADNFKTGFHLEYARDFFISTPIVDLVPFISYSSLARKRATGESGGNLDIVTVGPELKLTLTRTVKLTSVYPMAGLGVAITNRHSISGPGNLSAPSQTKVRFYFDLGAGADHKILSRFSVYISARYLRVVSDDNASAILPITLGISIDT